MVRVDSFGWLLSDKDGDPRIVHHSTSRVTALELPKPLGAVWHWTAGRGGQGFADGCCKEIEHYDPSKDRAASWHLLLAKNGDIHQCASFLVGTWHVGKPGNIGGHQSANINRCTVGIEIENAGRLLKLGPRTYCWPFWLNPDAPLDKRQPDPKLEVAPFRAVLGEGGFWKEAEGGLFDAFTPQQIASATAVLMALVAEYKWDPAACGYGHVMFDWPRREDPGPLWLKGALPGILDAVFPKKVCEPA